MTRRFSPLGLFLVSLFSLSLLAAGSVGAAPPPPGDAAREEHREFTRERLLDYFKYEYPIGTHAVKVTDAKISLDETLPVQGWANRFRSKGRAYIEYFDSTTRSFNRFHREFEAVTQKNDEGVITLDSLKVT